MTHRSGGARGRPVAYAADPWASKPRNASRSPRRPPSCRCCRCSTPGQARLASVARPRARATPGSGAQWTARLLGTFYVDGVIGKQEMIDYALALDPAGRVLRLDVLAYRETHGWRSRNERWRAQFASKTATDPVELSRDIANISGATLSCRHVTDGVRRPAGPECAAALRLSRRGGRRPQRAGLRPGGGRPWPGARGSRAQPGSARWSRSRCRRTTRPRRASTPRSPRSRACIVA